jgi:hypothetical protein
VKKIKITVNDDSQGKTFTLFPTPEALFVWLTDPDCDEDIPGIEHVKISPGEFIEAEWCGCENIFVTTNEAVTLNMIRLARAHRSENSSGLLVDTFIGWTTKDIVPFKNYADEHVTIQRIDGPDDGLLMLDVLFGDEPISESKPEQ